MKSSGSTKKILGSVLLVIGVLLVVFGSIISGKVDEGDKKIRSSQRAINTIKRVTRIHPISRDIGRAATKPTQRKINKGRKEANTYRSLSIICLIVGIVSTVFGAALLFWGFMSKK